MTVPSKRFARRATTLLALLFATCAVAVGQGQETPFKSISYHLSMSRPASHLFEVSIDVEKAGSEPAAVDFQMPRWSPGRYAVFDFAKNVQEVRAVAGICPPNAQCKRAPLRVVRVDDQTWRVETRETAGLTLSYKVFGDDLSGTFSQLDERHANYNGGSIFMYIAGHKQEPVRLTIEPPARWRIVNGRTEKIGQREWRFPNYDLLIDTPTEIAPDWTIDEFKVDGKMYRVVVHSFGNENGKRAALVRDIEKIVRAETGMWGTPDFETYTFLIHFAADDRSGDGMEHLTSTQIIEPGALGDTGTYESALDTVAHEFFHVWNVKRLRPAEFGPWDFTRPANTRSLWIAEGITNYYGHMMMRRAGIWTEARLLERLSEQINNIENAQGSRLMSAEESSLSAPFLDGSAHEQRTNLTNTSISYYTKGEVLGLVLDLLIRGKTRGRASLDDVMRRMYEEFYVKSPNASYYLRGRGYTGEDFERAASEVAGTDLHDFFERYVRDVETPPYDEALAAVGLRLVRELAREPYTAGITLDFQEPQSAKIWNVRNGSAAEDGGLKQGDVIVSLGGENVTHVTWLSALNRHKQGSRIAVTVRRDRQTIQTTITLGEPDRHRYRLEELKDASPQTRALRNAWLKG
ncbi:MAG: PDZ domain-containing protein [Pyrinomonadaceae bacterium]